jgi:hypothetical protein
VSRSISRCISDGVDSQRLVGLLLLFLTQHLLYINEGVGVLSQEFPTFQLVGLHRRSLALEAAPAGLAICS